MRKCPFFLRGCPLICIKNRTFLLSLIFFEKDLDIMFKYLLNNIKNFLDYKNVILTYSKHDHFSKGGNPGFSSKIWKFFWVSFSLKKTYTWCLIMFWIKKEFLDYKNVILTSWDNVHISREVKPGFLSKFWNFFWLPFPL